MSYVYDEAEKLEGLPTVGTGQCVQLIKQFANAPPASQWKEGKSVKGQFLLKKGTAIATFENGKYSSRPTGNHAGFYLSQDAIGILIVDQWLTSGTIRKRPLLFKGKGKDGKFNNPSNNGDAFSVIE